MPNASTLISKLWSYCHILRDDDGDYVEQLTFLLFLKMTHERTQPPCNQPPTIPEDYSWPTLVELDGIPLEIHYRRTLETLSKEPGMLRTIFRKAQNKIQDPPSSSASSRTLIDKESWSVLDADVKGDIYEGLLQKNAEDVKSGTGQYFTPRPR
jgi:type I restriction enzyme M protein